MFQYEILGRRKVSPQFQKPKVFRMRIFAANSVIARSRFWYYMSKLQKIKKANGEIIDIHQIYEKNANHVKNFGFWIRYDSRSGTHNMYKEYRDTTLTAAVKKMYAEMASRHRARRSSVQVIKTAIVKGNDCKRTNVLQFIDPEISFQLPHRVNKPSDKSFRRTYKATAPCSFF